MYSNYIRVHVKAPNYTPACGTQPKERTWATTRKNDITGIHNKWMGELESMCSDFSGDDERKDFQCERRNWRAILLTVILLDPESGFLMKEAPVNYCN